MTQLFFDYFHIFNEYAHKTQKIFSLFVLFFFYQTVQTFSYKNKNECEFIPRSQVWEPVPSEKVKYWPRAMFKNWQVLASIGKD